MQRAIALHNQSRLQIQANMLMQGLPDNCKELQDTVMELFRSGNYGFLFNYFPPQTLAEKFCATPSPGKNLIYSAIYAPLKSLLDCPAQSNEQISKTELTDWVSKFQSYLLIRAKSLKDYDKVEAVTLIRYCWWFNNILTNKTEEETPDLLAYLDEELWSSTQVTI